MPTVPPVPPLHTRPAPPVALRDILQAAVRAYGWQDAEVGWQVKRLWPVVVGSGMAQRTRVIGYHEGVVTVGVASSVWAQELTYLAPRLLQRLAQLWPADETKPPLRELRPRVLPHGRLSAAVVRRQGRGRAAGWRRVPVPAGMTLEESFRRARQAYQQRVLDSGAYGRCRRCGAAVDDGFDECSVCARPRPGR